MWQCQFPDCSYCTTDRFSIDYHHIKPKELGGSDQPFNRIWLCPTHHRHIFVPEAKTGLHSMKTNGSIIVHGFIYSSAGPVLHFTDCGDDIEYYYMYSKKLKGPVE